MIDPLPPESSGDATPVAGELRTAPGLLPKRRRSSGLDLLRVVTVASIVLTHNWQEPWASAWFSTWHTLIFFVLTGYFWKDDRTLRDEVRRRTRTLLVPYLSWLVIVTVIFQIRLTVQHGEPDLGWLIRAAAGGSYPWRPYSPFWFITTLFFAIVLMRWLSRFSDLLVWVVAAVGLLWCAVRPESMIAIPEGLGLALPAMGFIAVGRVLRRNRERIRHPLIMGGVLAVPAILLGGFGFVAPLDLKYGVLGDPLVSVVAAASISCGLILLAEAADRILPRWSARPIAAVAAVAMPVILGHTLVLWFTAQAGMEPSKWTFLLAYLITVGIGLLIARTPLRRVLL